MEHRKLVALRSFMNEDWKTQASRGYGCVPKGAIVDYVKMVQNLYGTYVLIEYNGNRYYTYPNNVAWAEDSEVIS